MYDCIFTPHCIENVCDKSCPAYVETSYLLERNGLQINNPVFNSNIEDIETAKSVLSKVASKQNKFGVVPCNNTIGISNLLTYCAICQNWKGNRLHCNVYNLKFSSYLEEMKKSWSYSNPSDKFEYQQIWASTAKVLIISNVDYVQFKNFEVQTLLNLIHSRTDEGLTTILVSPPLNNLFGDGLPFMRMSGILGPEVIRWR